MSKNELTLELSHSGEGVGKINMKRFEIEYNGIINIQYKEGLMKLMWLSKDSYEPSFWFDHVGGGGGKITNDCFKLTYKGRVNVNYQEEFKTMVIMWLDNSEETKK